MEKWLTWEDPSILEIERDMDSRNPFLTTGISRARVYVQPMITLKGDITGFVESVNPRVVREEMEIFEESADIIVE